MSEQRGQTAAVLQSRPEPATPGEWQFPDVRRTELSNGLGLATCHLPGQAVIELRLVVEGGARSDPAGLEGLTLVTGRALAESTARLDVDAFADTLETLGARIGSELHWDALVLAASAPRSRLTSLLELLAEVVTSPGFRTADVERVLRQRRDEATRMRQYPQARVSDAFNAALFAPGTRKAVGAGGSVDTLSAITPDAVAPHWAGLAQPERATLAVIGDLEGIDVPALVGESLSGWVSTGVSHEPPRPVEASTRGALSVVDLPGAVQTQLAVGLATDTVDVEQRPALRLAVHALGGHFNSTLMSELREHRGVTYGVSAGVDHSGGASMLAVQTAVQVDATAESVVEIIRQMREMAAAPDEAAIAQAADNLVRTGPTSYRSGAAVAAAVVRNTIEALPDDYDDRMRAAIAATTPSEAGAALSSILRDGLVVAAVGDASTVADKLAAAAGTEPVVEPV